MRAGLVQNILNGPKVFENSFLRQVLLNKLPQLISVNEASHLVQIAILKHSADSANCFVLNLFRTHYPTSLDFSYLCGFGIGPWIPECLFYLKPDLGRARRPCCFPRNLLSFCD